MGGTPWRLGRIGLLASALTALAALAPTSAFADAPTWFLSNSNTGGIAETWFKYGNPGDIPLAGDWDGDGMDTPGVARPNPAGWMDWYLRNSNSQGVSDISFALGNRTDRTLTGDWNRDRIDTPAVTRPNAAGWLDWWLKNANDGTWRAGDHALAYGNGSGDVSVVGDWNGDGIATPAVYRRSTATFYLADDFSGNAVAAFSFGTPGNTDDVVIGDWNGDGYDSIGLFRRSTAAWTLSNSNASGAVTFKFVYGNAGDVPVVGDWNGDGTDTVGVVRTATVAYPTSAAFGGANGVIDTDAEIGAVLTALGAADSDADWNAIWNGMTAAEQARVQKGLKYEDDTLLRDTSTGRVYLYADGAVAWVTNATVAARLDINLSTAISVAGSVIASYRRANDITEAALNSPDEPSPDYGDAMIASAGHPRADKGYFWEKPDPAHEENVFIFSSIDNKAQFRGTLHWYRHRWNLWKRYVQWQGGSRSQALFPGICQTSSFGAKWGGHDLTWSWPPGISFGGEASSEGYTKCPADDYTNAADTGWGRHRPVSPDGKTKGNIKYVVVTVCWREDANSPRLGCVSKKGKRNGDISDY
jgi:hypothetical protein